MPKIRRERMFFYSETNKKFESLVEYTSSTVMNAERDRVTVERIFLTSTC